MGQYKDTAKDCLEDLVSGIQNSERAIKDSAKSACGHVALYTGLTTYIAANAVPGMVVPSELREKWYEKEDDVYRKIGLYECQDVESTVRDARSVSAGALEFMGLVAIVPGVDLLARMHYLQDSDEFPEFMQRNMSDTYLPASMPIEVLYCAIKAPFQHIKERYGGNQY